MSPSNGIVARCCDVETRMGLNYGDLITRDYITACSRIPFLDGQTHAVYGLAAVLNQTFCKLYHRTQGEDDHPYQVNPESIAGRGSIYFRI